jgi:hypothetical protein
MVFTASGSIPANGATARRAGGAPARPTSGASLTVRVTPNPDVETGPAEVHAVVQVSGPSFAGQDVTISSSQLQAACAGSFTFETLQGGSASTPVTGGSLSVALDNLGHAAVSLSGSSCAPGPSAVDASLSSAPGTNATTDLDVDPPQGTTTGLYGYPASDLATSDGDVYAVFDMEMNSAYAGSTVGIESVELENDCAGGWRWEPGNGGTATTQGTATTILDDFGNATFVFEGNTCAAGHFTVKSLLTVAPYTTDSTTLTLVSDAPTITGFSPGKGRHKTKVTITGTNLSGASAVTFNGTSAVIGTDTATKITTKVPMGATTGRIQVTTAAGEVTSATSFKVT